VHTVRTGSYAPDMGLRFSGQTSIFGVLFFVLKSLLASFGNREIKEITVLT